MRSARILGAVAALLTVIVLAAAALGWWTLRASLPDLDGHAALPNLAARVVIERDSEGVPTITAQNREDLARALGYLHGQDRFFQMDLLRRAAAGELSSLLGPGLLPADRELRPHRFRAVAHAIVAQLDGPGRSLLDAYAAGVNAGLASLASRPFEYWLLRSKPAPWTDEDSILCVHAMFLQLQDALGHAQLQRGLLRAKLPPGLWRFLESGSPEWDAAVDGSRAAEPRIPEAAEIDLRSLQNLPVLPPASVARQLDDLGSNNWAVAGFHTGNGAAIVANDMHLDFRVPNIWYRARLIEQGPAGFDAVGVTLPGTPSIVAGSNRRVAWGFTNSYGQFARVIRMVGSGDDPSVYATAQGPRPYRYVDEAIEVKGAAAEHLKVPETQWGPVLGKDWEGQPYALAWTAQDPSAVNFKLLELERASSVEDALRAAGEFGIPAQNLMVADASGHIGWTIAGRIPVRSGETQGVPVLSTDQSPGFSGWIAPQDQPRVIDPPGGFLWSANARVIGGSAEAVIGDDGMDRGARAAQIESDLQHAAAPFTPRSSLAVQLDDRALFLDRWRTLLGAVIERARTRGERGQDAAHDVLARWSGHAAADDAAYRLVNLFRDQVEARAFYMLIAPARAQAPDFSFEIPSSFEGPLWRLIEQRPPHLLARDYADWDSFLHEALLESERLPPACAALASCGWGKVNEVRVAHPLSAAVPWLSKFLDMPVVFPPGAHHDMPRIQGRDYGASERFSVAPGHEEEAYFHMPGGQSGHPLSPYYRAGFAAWADGLPTPFLPGAAAHEFALTPAG